MSAGHTSSPDSRRALESLCETYWYPLYAYVRRRVPDVSEAQDLTQAFFAELLEKNYVGSATPDRGRFRAFLLDSLQALPVQGMGEGESTEARWRACSDPTGL